MDKEKKKELAEMDGRWNFEKTFRTQNQVSWESARKTFNEIQENHGDLYMTVDKLELPGRLDRMRLWFKQWKYGKSYGRTMTFHHEQVYNWFLKLANELDMSVGRVLDKFFVLDDETVEWFRSYFDLGDTVNVEINSIDAMSEPEESKVSRDELEEMINDE